MLYQCQVKELTAQPILSIRGTVSVAAIAPTTGEFLTEVWG